MKKKAKRKGRNSKKYIVVKEYYEDIVFKDPDTGELCTQENVLVTRYELKSTVDPYGPASQEDSFISRIGISSEEYEEEE